MFATTPVYNVDGDVVHGLMRRQVLEDPTDDIYVVTQNGQNRLWLISHVHYNTPDLWWVIASVNNIVDPMLGVPTGTELKIPKAIRLSEEGILTS